MNKAAWRVPDNERPPERFWLEFGKLVMATLRGDDSEEYLKTLIEWADFLQRRYGGHEITGRVILDYLDAQMARLQEEPEIRLEEVC